MTTITMQRSSGNYSIDLQGHADYAEAGKDIVCAGLSILTYTFMQTLSDLEGDGYLHNLDMCENQVEGTVHIEFTYGGCTYICLKVNQTIKTIETGFKLLEESYPDYVKIVGGK